jgi:hypothetical protein
VSRSPAQNNTADQTITLGRFAQGDRPRRKSQGHFLTLLTYEKFRQDYKGDVRAQPRDCRRARIRRPLNAAASFFSESGSTAWFRFNVRQAVVNATVALTAIDCLRNSRRLLRMGFIEPSVEQFGDVMGHGQSLKRFGKCRQFEMNRPTVLRTIGRRRDQSALPWPFIASFSAVLLMVARLNS